MRQAGHRVFVFFGGTFLVGAGLIAAACGTDNGSTTTVPTVDGGRDGTASSSGASSGTTSSGGSSGDPGDSGADCANIPTPKSGDGPYCFSVLDASADGGTAPKACDNSKNEVCCSGQPLGDAGFEPSTCEVADAGAGGFSHTCSGYAWQTAPRRYDCAEKAHCAGAGGGYCCAIAADAGVSLLPGSNKDFPGCPVYYQSPKFVGGSRCETECAAGELTLCAKDADCKAGKCVPITIDGRYTGYCRL
jgi:hypothetical protein